MQLKVIRRKGYNVVEAVPGTLPVYDEYTITRETEKEFPQAFGYPHVFDRENHIAEMTNYEAATVRGIEAALAKI